MRNFIRHASDIPLDVNIESSEQTHCNKTVNISMGGISFVSEKKIRTGKRVSISVPSISDSFHFEGQVAWCQEFDDQFTIGIQFYDEEHSYTARMVEQICQIESYRNEVLKTQKRHLTSDEAAEEWISQYAHTFPELAFVVLPPPLVHS